MIGRIFKISGKTFEMSKTPSFIVNYSFNCDGGKQELGAASEAIKRVFPTAVIKAVGSDSYPIKVKVETTDGKVLWEGKQQALFSKYREDRTKSQLEIQAAVESLKQ
jgi:hypothetical protein